MLAVTMVVGCLSVCGFYAYVLLQLHREQKRLKRHKKRLPEHLYEMEPELDRNAAEGRDDSDLRSRASISPKTKAQEFMRRETLIHLTLGLVGLAVVFAGIEFFNSLVTWLHWY
jgi:hypothetical protein